MPKYKAHLAGGLIFCIVSIILITKLKLFNLQLNYLPIYISFCLFGSLFPDIDTKSKIQKFSYYPLFLLTLIAIFMQNWLILTILSFIIFIPILANHRNLTHRKWFVIVVPAIIPILAIHYKLSESNLVFSGYIFFVIGALSHLLLDFGPRKFFKFK